MKMERIGPAGEGEASVQLAGEPVLLTASGSKKQPISGAPLHLIAGRNGPSMVAGTYRNGSTFVTVCNAPWGSGNLNREFLHPKSKAAERYALSLRQRFADAAWAEQARREGIKALKRKEQEALR